jgi:hypothetical protein
MQVTTTDERRWTLILRPNLAVLKRERRQRLGAPSIGTHTPPPIRVDSCPLVVKDLLVTLALRHGAPMTSNMRQRRPRAVAWSRRVKPLAVCPSGNVR